jgi:hypothetical protein
MMKTMKMKMKMKTKRKAKIKVKMKGKLVLCWICLVGIILREDSCYFY